MECKHVLYSFDPTEQTKDLSYDKCLTVFIFYLVFN